MIATRTFCLVLLVSSFASAQLAEPDLVPSPDSAPAEPGAEPVETLPVVPPPAAGQPPAGAQPAPGTQPTPAAAPGQPAAQPTPAAPGAQPAEPAPWQLPPEAELPPYTRRPGEVYLGFGAGNAMCDSDEPDSKCPVSGALVGTVGGGWRFHPHLSVGLEVAAWGYRVRDEWRGQLAGEPTDTSLTSLYAAVYGRWYWLDRHIADPYLVVGIGGGVFRGEASNAARRYKFTATGAVLPLGIGVEWQVVDIFRLGPQLLAYVHASARICEKPPPEPGDPECRSPTENEDNEREGLALPWRVMAVGTFTLGRP
jgi:hypothetical protein